MENRIKELVVLANDVYTKTTALDDLYKQKEDGINNAEKLKEIYNKPPQEIFYNIETYTDTSIDEEKGVEPYFNPEAPDILGDDNYNSCSFKANVYYSKDSNNIIISYKGSKELQDFVEDGKIFFGHETAQLQYAKELYEKIKETNPNANITLTGHSLGGMLATQVRLDAILDKFKDKGLEITKENYLAIKDDIAEVVGFETPSIFFSWRSKTTGRILGKI